jgi:hypothetical protein
MLSNTSRSQRSSIVVRIRWIYFKACALKAWPVEGLRLFSQGFRCRTFCHEPVAVSRLVFRGREQRFVGFSAEQDPQWIDKVFKERAELLLCDHLLFALPKVKIFDGR